jgi:SAM-dependent methyltransferase
MDRLVWTPAEVVDVDGPRAVLRAYLEQRAVREMLKAVCPADSHANAAACDVGCGFGRLTPVLTEFAASLVGFEREPDLVATARRLQPGIDFRPLDTLTALPADAASFDLGLVFTVLQHVPEPEVRAVIAEIRRILKPGGILLLCEETDPSLEAGDRRRADLGYTCGRPVERYETWLAPWTLVATRKRIIEPDYPRPDVGTYMLFRAPALRLA